MLLLFYKQQHYTDHVYLLFIYIYTQFRYTRDLCIYITGLFLMKLHRIDYVHRPKMMRIITNELSDSKSIDNWNKFIPLIRHRMLITTNQLLIGWPSCLKYYENIDYIYQTYKNFIFLIISKWSMDNSTLNWWHKSVKIIFFCGVLILDSYLYLVLGRNLWIWSPILSNT